MFGKVIILIFVLAAVQVHAQSAPSSAAIEKTSARN
jgi:hypothetical protein